MKKEIPKWVDDFKECLSWFLNKQVNEVLTKMEELQKMADKNPDEHEFEVEGETNMEPVVDVVQGIVDTQKKALLEHIQKLLVDEMLICHKEGTPTSRLTSLSMKLRDL